MAAKMVWEADINGEGINNVIGRGKLSNVQAGRAITDGSLRLWLDILWTNRVPIDVPAAYARNPQSLQYTEQTTVINGELKVSVAQHGGPVAVLIAMGPMGTPYSRGMEWKGPLSREVLEWIEDRRKGDDFAWDFHLRAVVFRAGQLKRASDSIVVAASSVIDTVSGTWESVPMAASTWVTKFLPQLGYHGPQYVELPALPSFESGQSVRHHFDSALLALRQGNYRAVPMHCLSALDALAKSRNYDGFGAIPDVNEWLSGSIPERVKVLSSFRHYLNRWRHDNTAKGAAQESTPPLEHEEASFIYVTAVYMAQIIARHLPRMIV